MVTISHNRCFTVRHCIICEGGLELRQLLDASQSGNSSNSHTECCGKDIFCYFIMLHNLRVMKHEWFHLTGWRTLWTVKPNMKPNIVWFGHVLNCRHAKATENTETLDRKWTGTTETMSHVCLLLRQLCSRCIVGQVEPTQQDRAHAPVGLLVGNEKEVLSKAERSQDVVCGGKSLIRCQTVWSMWSKDLFWVLVGATQQLLTSVF